MALPPERSRVLAALIATAALLLAGCDDNEDEEGATIPTTPTVAQPTATAPTTTQPAATTPTTAAPEPTPAAPTSDPNACETERTISRLKFQGVSCEDAATIANTWDREQDRCSTIDDPDSPEGYNRTCEIEAYTCRAKRDVKSDARFVACAKGAAQVRFTWAPP